MERLIGEVNWSTRENDDGSISLVAMLCFSAGLVIPIGIVGVEEKEEFAKRSIIRRLFARMYGDLDAQLRDLEVAISRSTPPYYSGEDALVRCRKIQRDIWDRFYGPHATEMLGLRR